MQACQGLRRAPCRRLLPTQRTVSFFAVPPTPSTPQASSSSFDSSSSLPAMRPKPAEPSWYTGSPQYFAVVDQLQATLHSTRADLHAKSILSSYSSNAGQALAELGLDKRGDEASAGWLQQDRMALQLGTKLSLSQYRKLTSLLNALRALKPHLELADNLGMPFSSGSLATELEEMLAGYKRPAASSALARDAASAQDQLDEHGRSYAVGRRKESSAQAWLLPAADAASTPGQVLLNARPLSECFASPATCQDVLQPFTLTGTLGQFNVFALSRGGGPTGQAGAVRLAIAKALLPFMSDVQRTALKKEGLLRRDPRMVERKKAGQPKARKKYTWVKR